MDDSAIVVCLRVRPPKSEDERRCIRIDEESASVVWDDARTFTYDSVASEFTTQSSVFDMVGKPIADAAFAGFHATCFAYGQTGSGKTHTMMGKLDAKGYCRVREQRGIAPRSLERLFELIQESTSANVGLGGVPLPVPEFEVRCSMVEIYGQRIADLLAPSDRWLTLRETRDRGMLVEGAQEMAAANAQEATELLMQGNRNRTTGKTMMNCQSSRSHCIFTVELTSRWRQPNGSVNLRSSRMNLVDLAGSERQSSTSAVGITLKEAGQINMSLTALAMVIRALGTASTGKETFIPYRESKLTTLLKDSLGGNSKTSIVAAVSPTVDCKAETLSTLEFASSAKKIKNKAEVNMKCYVNTEQLLLDLERIKSENMALKRMMAQSPGKFLEGGTISLDVPPTTSRRRVTELEKIVNVLKDDLTKAQRTAKDRESECHSLKQEVRKVKDLLSTASSQVEGGGPAPDYVQTAAAWLSQIDIAQQQADEDGGSVPQGVTPEQVAERLERQRNEPPLDVVSLSSYGGGASSDPLPLPLTQQQKEEQERRRRAEALPAEDPLPMQGDLTSELERDMLFGNTALQEMTIAAGAASAEVSAAPAAMAAPEQDPAAPAAPTDDQAVPATTAPAEPAKKKAPAKKKLTRKRKAPAAAPAAGGEQQENAAGAATEQLPPAPQPPQPSDAEPLPEAVAWDTTVEMGESACTPKQKPGGADAVPPLQLPEPAAPAAAEPKKRIAKRRPSKAVKKASPEAGDEAAAPAASPGGLQVIPPLPPALVDESPAPQPDPPAEGDAAALASEPEPARKPKPARKGGKRRAASKKAASASPPKSADGLGEGAGAADDGTAANGRPRSSSIAVTGPRVRGAVSSRPGTSSGSASSPPAVRSRGLSASLPFEGREPIAPPSPQQRSRERSGTASSPTGRPPSALKRVAEIVAEGSGDLRPRSRSLGVSPPPGQQEEQQEKPKDDSALPQAEQQPAQEKPKRKFAPSLFRKKAPPAAKPAQLAESPAT